MLLQVSIRVLSFTLLLLGVFWAAQAGAGASGSDGYVLGPDDQILVQAMHMPEIADKPIRVDSSGYITLPFAGRLKAAGLTVEQLQASIGSRLDEFIQGPEVSVSIVEYKSQPVSIVGAVNTPGIYQLQGKKHLADVLSMAGGPKPEAADTVRITRHGDCGSALPNPHADPANGYTIGEVSLNKLFQGRAPLENIVLCSGDVLTLPRAPIVYVLGEVRKPGGFPLRDKEIATVLEAVSMSEGLTKTAAGNHARILRVPPNGGQRQEIAVDVKSILDGKAEDIAMRADDILFVPNSTGKAAWTRSSDAIIQMATGIVVWGRF